MVVNSNLQQSRAAVKEEDVVATVTAIQHKHLTSLLLVVCFRTIQAAGTRPGHKGAGAIFQQRGGGGQSIS